jgi:hypothetical protein
MFSLSAILALLNARAKAVRDLGLDALEITRTNEEIVTWMVMALTALASALVAGIAPPRVGVWAGFVYPTLMVTMPSVSMVYARRAAALARPDRD